MPTVLVVDDELTCVWIHEVFLKSAGFSVITSTDSEEALGHLRRGKVDAVITDIVRPGQMDGIEFLRRVREIAPETILIVISGSGSASRFEEASQLAHQVTPKPTVSGELVRVLKEQIRDSMLRSE